MATYPYELAQDAVCQSHTGRLTELWFLPNWPKGWTLMNEWIPALYKGIILQSLHFLNWLQIYIVSTINTITYVRSFEIAAGSKNISCCRKQPELPFVFKYSFCTDFVPLQWCPVMSKINFAPLVTYLYNRNTKKMPLVW
jgi:hypothetical protein